MKRNAKARWQGDLQSGKGEMSTDSGILSAAQYSFATRFEDGAGTNPEELIAAAHAGCFSMALSLILGQSDLRAESIDTQASVNLEKGDDGFAITGIHLTVRADVPGADDAVFGKAAEAAKAGCPVSKVINAEITMDAALAG